MNKILSKPVCVIRAPFDTRSGYGEMSRDIIHQIIDYGKYDVKLQSIPWGGTPTGVLNHAVPKDKILIDRIITAPLSRKPELFVTISIPSEFEALGDYNIGITAGIETTVASAQWVAACNKVDLVITISEHSKNVFLFSKYIQNNNLGQPIGEIKVNKPIEILHNCVDTNIFKKIELRTYLEPTIRDYLDDIPENFSYLFVGHWVRGDYGEDRKNVPLLIKIFLETFKGVPGEKPALILKTSGAGFSILDREKIKRNIEEIRKSVTLMEGHTLPNIYLIHGDLTDLEMNSLYNHPKVKAHVSLTKGEGFGRPLLEASLSGKPVIASGWSGQLDFLDPENAVLVGGELAHVHESATWENIIIKEATWFRPDPNQCANALYAVFSNYEEFRKRAAKLAKINSKKFSYQTIRNRMFELLDKYVPEFVVESAIILPPLKKNKDNEAV
jgi:glycosyltransferase involved in cell wall biosynthesis